MDAFKPKILLYHPTGNANVRALAEGLVKNEILESFYTCIALFQNSLLFKVFDLPVLREFYRRRFSPELKRYTYIRPFKELGRLASQKLGLERYIKHETGVFSVDNVYRDLDSYVSRRLHSVNALYAYEDGALKSFESAKKIGVRCFYDLPTGYWRAHEKFLNYERTKRPEWASTLKCFQDSQDKLRRKDRELQLADIIIVASNFTKETLKLYPGKLAPILLIPYGFPEVNSKRTYTSVRNRKLKLLFVGGLTQAKGIANVLEAVEDLKERVDLTIVGRKVVQECAPLEKQLLNHTWIPSLPHEEVLKIMAEQDILLFPSLFEGYGLVITEAMSQGTPVITTNRTCGRDFIKDGINSWLVEPGGSQLINAKLKSILREPECIPKIGRAAMSTASELPIESYGERITDALKVVFNDC